MIADTPGNSLAELVTAAIARRRDLLAALAREGTDCVRLLAGTVEGAPGVTVDRYGPVLLVQTWRAPLGDDDLAAVTPAASESLGIDLLPCWNHRGAGGGGSEWTPPPEPPIGHELGLAYDVRPRHRGQDPLLFLDLRAGRRRVRAAAAGKSVLNLFAYTCGVGVGGLAGGARRVLNVDFAASALAVARANAERNVPDPAALTERFVTIQDDVIPVVRQLAGLAMPARGKRARRYTRRTAEQFDLVVLDPPRWAKGTYGAVDVARDYPSLFKPALLATAPGGDVLATNHVPEVVAADWIATLERCAAKAGRPLASVEIIAPEDDFPSPDGRHPSKMAWVRVR
jgi:23S rRNA (cytosine1962-C5)-methyltransferase